MTRLGTFVSVAAAALLLTGSTARAQSACVGDCNGNNMVTINELILGVNIALGNQPITACEAFDCQGTGMVPINCLIQGVNNASNGCPPAPPTSTSTPEATATNTAEATATNTAAATSTNTAEATATNTPEATATNTEAATATNTAEATATNTPETTATNTAEATATNTGEATATATNTGEATATATDTAAATETATDTPVPTDTPTEGPTATPTATTGPVEHTCTLAMGSDINIYSAAFPVALFFSSAGSVINVGGVGDVGSCSIQTFNPIFIVGIGFVCIAPATGCEAGIRYCGPGDPGSGPPLGVDVESDGNIGSCSGDTGCATACDAACPTTFGAGFIQLNSGCTGYCTGETPPDMACTSDAECGDADNGSCNGPDNAGEAMKNICQCTCINDDAFGGSDPGDLQCNLGADLTVEMQSPCNGTDILINVGQACIPVTTQRAKGKIINGNFVAGSTVPSAVTSCAGSNGTGSDCNDRDGAPIACAVLDGGSTTGLSGVGAVNFFGSTIGDLTVGLKAVCE
jgi:hypothetical protein